MTLFVALALGVLVLWLGGVPVLIALAVAVLAAVLVLGALVLEAFASARRIEPPALRPWPPNVTRLRPRPARGAHAPRAKRTLPGPLDPAA